MRAEGRRARRAARARRQAGAAGRNSGGEWEAGGGTKGEKAETTQKPASAEPRREQPARLRGENGAAREENRRQRATRSQSAQTLQIRACALRATPATTAEHLDELDLAVQEV